MDSGGGGGYQGVVSATLLLGPAGSGKTHRCIEEIREILDACAEGPPLVFLAPKQATFQLERQILTHPGPAGFSRLRILSFERLAQRILEHSGTRHRRLISEETRIMVLRALLTRHHSELTVFGGSSRSPGFARQLSEFLRLLQQAGYRPTPPRHRPHEWSPVLAGKLADAWHLLQAYRHWLESHDLGDTDDLLPSATTLLAGGRLPPLSGVWLDGFATLTPPEEDLLVALLSAGVPGTLAFCIPEAGLDTVSSWSPVAETVSRLRSRLSAAGTTVAEQLLPTSPVPRRFHGHAGMGRLERALAAGVMFRPVTPETGPDTEPAGLETVQCAHPTEEAEFAAGLVLEHVRGGGRFREVAVLVRGLEAAAPTIERVFRRHGIPLFVDRREPVTHHPLLELTRAAVRVAAHEWRTEDIFSVLKSGLVELGDWGADRLENECLAHGWTAREWSGEDRTGRLPAGAVDAVGPLRRMSRALRGTVTGPHLAGATRRLWEDYPVTATLKRWEERHPSVEHSGILRQLTDWTMELEAAFATESMPATDWVPIVESALAGLTIGRVPPALDQVLLGGLDRSRNPELSLVILPGWVEGVFPAPVPDRPLLPRHEADSLAEVVPSLANPVVRHASMESYLAYIGLTRAGRRALVTWSRRGPFGEATEASRFVKALGPLVDRERIHQPLSQTILGPESLEMPHSMRLTSPVAAALYGRVLATSPTRLETHATCPFLAYGTRTLAVDERDTDRFDERKRGTLEHALLAQFTRLTTARAMRWRDLSDAAASALLDEALTAIAEEHLPNSPRGRLQADRSRELVGDFLGEARSWMKEYPLEPSQVEVRFGGPSDGRQEKSPPPLCLRTHSGEVLLQGRIDRLDIAPASEAAAGTMMVVDYKHGTRRFDPRGLETGLDLQLALYAAAARQQLDGAAGEPGPLAGFVYAPLKASRPGKSSPGRPPADASRSIRRLAGRVVDAGDGARLDTRALPLPRGSRIPAAEMDRLIDQALTTSRSLAEDLLQGNTQARPHPSVSPPPCDRCPLLRTCRIGG